MRKSTRQLRVAMLLGASLLALHGSAAPALAQPPEGRDFVEGPRGMGHRGPPPIDAVMERHADELGLDAATRAAIQQIADRSRLVEEPLREELHAIRDEMRGLLDADSPNLDDVMQWAERSGAVETELKKQRLRTMLEVRALLSPEQRQKLVKIFEERRARRHRPGDDSPAPPADQETER
jgi:Spy/CpxP family protein refolding chaperone